MKNTLNIFTACSRLENIFTVYNSIKPYVKKLDNGEYNIYWYVIQGGKGVTLENYRRQFDSIEDPWIIEGCIDESTYGKSQWNWTLDMIKDGWCFGLDDDNILHPNMYFLFDKHKDEDLNGIIGNQIDKFNNLRLIARPSDVRVCHIDISSYILKREYIGDKRFGMEYSGDGRFIEELYKANPEKFLFINEPISYFNFLR
jgi:hypothetical protein